MRILRERGGHAAKLEGTVRDRGMLAVWQLVMFGAVKK